MVPRSCRGFTLLEVIVVLAVAATLFTLAIPSYRSMVERNSMAAGMNSLVGGLNYARSQAVTRDKNVCICGRAGENLGQCSASGDWQQGWLVYLSKDGSCPMNPDALSTLRIDSGLGQNFKMQTIEGNQPISFNGSGFAMASNATICAGRPSEAFTRKIVIASTGRIETSDSAEASCAPRR